MATLVTGRLYDLVARFFFAKRRVQHAIVDVIEVHYSAVQALAGANAAEPFEGDDVWLGRVELRGARQVVAALQKRGFHKRRGALAVLFVDNRCGLIEAHELTQPGKADADRLISDILLLASKCHARGMLLATQERREDCSSGTQTLAMAMALHRKGEAVGIFLLDHFVLTGSGWRVFSIGDRGRL